MRESAPFLVLGLLLGLLISTLEAQTLTSRFERVLTDPSGAMIPGATVTITNQGTNDQLATVSPGVGLFLFTNVRLGTYTLQVEMPGFSTAMITDIKVDVGLPVTRDFALEFGAVDAASFFNNAAGLNNAKLILNQFGGRVGGPVVRDKLFFFAHLEFYR